MTDYSIEAAGLTDLDQLVRVEDACFQTPWSRESLSALLSDQTKCLCLVACRQELEFRRVVGYIGLIHVLDEGEIANIAVHPEYAGQGVGFALLEAVKQFCAESGILTIHLEVRPSNAPALALYRKCGFLPTGRRRGYYSDTGEDALLMAWNVM